MNQTQPTSPTTTKPDAPDEFVTVAYYQGKKDEVVRPSQDLAEAAVKVLLRHAGYDPQSEDLIDTPGRVAKAILEMTAGRTEDPKVLLSKRFKAKCSNLITVRGIEFDSLCEHHLLPFSGVAHVCYIPPLNGEVVGLSKIPRLVECFARRLQMQERMTEQIADCMEECLKPVGVGVVTIAKHSCMSCRGVRKAHADMVCSSVRGVFFHKPEARAEFLALCGAPRG